MKDPNLIVTNIDEIKQSLINRFKNDPNSPYKDYDFEGSNLNFLMDLLAYVTAYNNFYSAVNVNEMFLPYAQKDKNVMALARTLCYQPKRTTGAIAYIRPQLPNDILNNPNLNKDIVIPIYTNVKSGRGLNYILMEEVRFRYNTATKKYELYRNNLFEPSDSPYYYKLKQGQFKYTSLIPSLSPMQRVIIDKTNIDSEKSSIVVQDVVTHEYWSPFYDVSDFQFDTSMQSLLESNTTIEQLKNELVLNNSWNNFVLDLNSAKIFFVDSDTSNTYLTFGDGSLGQIPQHQLDIVYILTDGISGNGDNQFQMVGSTSYKRVDGSTANFNNKKLTIELRNNDASFGGANAETVYSIRNTASSFYNTQNREVTEKDYETFLLQQNSIPLRNVKCIGGEKMKPIIMGAVGVCANKSGSFDNIKQTLLEDEEKELLTFVLKNQNIVTINPVFINPEFVKVNIDLKIFYNPLKYEDTATYTVAVDAVDTYFSTIEGFKKYFKSSNLVYLLDSINEIDHNLLSADLEYLRIFNKKELEKGTFINFGYKNIIKQDSIAKLKSKDYFLKIYNENTYYDWTEYNPITEEGVFVKPTGSSNWNFNDYFGVGTYSNVHKIFLYDIAEVQTNDSNVANLVLIEKTPRRLIAKRIDGSNDAPFFFEYDDIVETGKIKLIGKVYYNDGLIKLYLDDMSFKTYDINKKSKYIALETIKTEVVKYTSLGESTVIEYSDYDSKTDSYSSYEDLFFFDYEFDSITNLPKNQERIPLDEFYFEFAFDTVEEDFKSEGNIILTKGTIEIEREREV